ncbi:hypothetical protein EDD11_001446 [Mortierella claussenii]|nr:hypothetical protein EDD11_001446 [Mortierella claussenii]
MSNLSPPFFNKFGIFKNEDGNLRYRRVLRQANLCEQERVILTTNFEVWKSSEVEIFWERRTAKVVAEKSAWKTAGNLVDGFEPFAATIIAENANEQRQRFENFNISGQSSGRCQVRPDDLVKESEGVDNFNTNN